MLNIAHIVTGDVLSKGIGFILTIYLTRVLGTEGYGMVTVAVVATTMAVALPSFNRLLADNRITSETNRLVSDIQLARSEALKRGARIVICRSANPYAATPECGGVTNTWTSGWLVFASGDNNSTYDVLADTLIKVGHAANPLISVKTNSVSNNNLEFLPNSSTDEGGSTAKFVICDGRGAAHGKEVQVPPVGRPRLAKTVVSCSSPS